MHRVLLVSGVPIALGVALYVIFQPAALTNAIPDFKLPATEAEIIPPVDFALRGYPEVGLQYPPVAMGNKCLFYFSHVRNNTATGYGMYMADWLAQRAHEDWSFSNDYDWQPFQLKAGWKSGLAQAHVSECFMKAYEKSNDPKYLDYARNTLVYLKVPTSEGGVRIDEGNGKWWYEEYPQEGGSFVLNGHQFTLIALSEYLDIKEDAQIRELFDNGLKALKVDAIQYDNGTNSYYDRLGHPALKYHNTHIVNFQRLYEITEDPDWLVIKKVFES